MRNILSIILLSLVSLGLRAGDIHVIPYPVQVEMQRGTVRLPLSAPESVRIDAGMAHADEYRLTLSRKGVDIVAQSTAGLQYARETLAQLRAQYGEELPALTVTDYPRYEWRGLMLDCSRHFYSLEYLKKQVDMLAHYKMNRLHLHLTDDQGWRIEIKRYPELTQRGAWRTFNQQDSICIDTYKDQPEFELDPRFIVRNGDRTLYGGYYTQEELRSLVAYARERHVEIIPEIDMPGHTQAISAIYPQFTATGEASWGTIFSVPLSPAKEEVYTFLQHILDEVMDIFPSHYIHIGADEVEKNTWRESAECRQLMDRLGFKTYEALQSYFVNRIHDYLQQKGREMICWDDAIEGGDYQVPGGKGALSPSADVMYWRYWVGGVPQRVVEQGHHIIFTPGDPMYVARPDGPLYDIYHYQGLDLIPDSLQHLVRGGQVSLWGESMSNFRRADYCIYPRMVALAELLWTPAAQRNWQGFKERLEVEKAWLTAHDVHYARTNALLTAMQAADKERKCMLLTFDSEYAAPDIRYTLDGTVPTLSSPRYDGQPIAVTEPRTVTAAIMENGTAREPLFSRELEYHKAVGATVAYTTARWHESYKAAEVATFTDGRRGGDGYGDGLWQGFTRSFDVVVDLGSVMPVSEFSMRFMQQIGPGVYMPAFVEVSCSEDGNAYSPVKTIANMVPDTQEGTVIKPFATPLEGQARYVKVHVENAKGFVFADEIVIR